MKNVVIVGTGTMAAGIAAGFISQSVPITILGRNKEKSKACLKKAILLSKKIDESKISFNIGPRINAAGRMKNGKIIVELLIEEDVEKANILSNEVEFLNQTRRSTEKNVLEEAETQIIQNSFKITHRFLSDLYK